MFKYENDMVRKLKTSRRKFVVGSLAAGSALISTRKAISSNTDDKAITEMQSWNSELGDGVDANPYGYPSEYENTL